jgi:hypothetical protein
LYQVFHIINAQITTGSPTSGTPTIVTMENLTITNGNASDGGGIINSAGLTLTNCTISNCTAQAGGGIKTEAGTTLTDCTISGNSAGFGGGIDATAGLTLTDCTLSGNSATMAGGGMYMDQGIVNFISCTVSGNTAAAGGGIYNFNIEGGFFLSNTIVAGNTAASNPDDISGLVMANYSLIQSKSGVVFEGGSATDIVGKAPLLAPLGNYGGPTETMALLPGSPAINAGNVGTGFLDQRGQASVDSNGDIGAFQSQGFTLSVASGDNQTAAVNTAFASPLVVQVTANNSAEPVKGGQVTFTPLTVSGALATLTGSPATISSSGQASVTAVANDTNGSFEVVASTNGAILGPSFTLTNLQSQTVTFGSLANQTYGNTISLGASASSGLPVTFTVISGPATVSGNVLTVTGAGTVTVEASQGGNGTFAAAAPVDQSFTVNPAPLTVTVNNVTIIQGQAIPTTFPVSYNGFVLGQGPTDLSGSLSFSTVTSSNTPGTFSVTATGLTSSNYAITFTPGTLTILSFAQATGSLQTQVDGAHLAQGLQSSLDTQLQEAIALFNAGDTTDAVSQLDAFISHVSAQSGKMITTTRASSWIASAQQINSLAG